MFAVTSFLKQSLNLAGTSLPPSVSSSFQLDTLNEGVTDTQTTNPWFYDIQGHADHLTVPTQHFVSLSSTHSFRKLNPSSGKDFYFWFTWLRSCGQWRKLDKQFPFVLIKSRLHMLFMQGSHCTENHMPKQVAFSIMEQTLIHTSTSCALLSPGLVCSLKCLLYLLSVFTCNWYKST